VPQTREARRDKYRGAMVGAAVGDAHGAPFEGRDRPVPSGEFEALVDRPHMLSYTDDTAMTIAMAESLIRCGSLDQDDLAVTFAAHWARDPHRRYGSGTAALLARIHAGGTWAYEAAAQFGGNGSFGNGAAMRVSPVAVHARGDVAVAASIAARSAVTTHTHELGVAGSMAQAAAISVALTAPASTRPRADEVAKKVIAATGNDVFAAELRRIADLVDARDSERATRALRSDVSALGSVPAALYCWLASTSFTEAIRTAIVLGGDTDTVAAMAGALVGAHLGVTAIPAEWRKRTEAGGWCAPSPTRSRRQPWLTEIPWRRGLSVSRIRRRALGPES
jgi:poly(ADP-ribose) glycohydrolase ARH3